MPAVHLFEMTDTPVVVESLVGDRIRITWGSDMVLSLDIGEAVDLVDAIATTLAVLSGPPETGYSLVSTPTEMGVARTDTLRRDENTIRSAAEIREALQ